jgi:hypothetical protein
VQLWLVAFADKAVASQADRSTFLCCVSRVIEWIRRESGRAVVCGLRSLRISKSLRISTARQAVRAKTSAIANSKGKRKKGALLYRKRPRRQC